MAKTSAKKAVIWNSLGKLSTQLISFVVSIIIARFLSPSDYGVIALLSIFISVSAALLDSGFENALIQKKEKNEADFSTVFFFNIAISALLYGLIFLFANNIAQFYDKPELTHIARIYGVVIIIQGFAAIQRAKLIIDLRFKDLAVVSLISVILSGIIGITMAFLDYGVYALLAQSISIQLFTTLGLWLKISWKPQLIFSVKSFKELFSFGSKLLIGGLLQRVYTNIYSLLIGKFYSSSDLGFFMKSSQLSKLPSNNLTTIIYQVLYPQLCSIQNDDNKMISVFYKYLRFSCFIIFPIMLIIVSVARPMISILLTDKWLDMVPFLQIMCFAYMLEPVQQYNWLLLNSKGRSDLSLKSEILKKTVSIILLLIALRIDLMYLCYSMLLCAIIDVIIIIYFVRKILPIGYKSEMKQIMVPLIAAIMSFIASSSFVNIVSNIYLQFIGGTIIGGFIYIAICLIMKYEECNIVLKKMKLKG